MLKILLLENTQLPVEEVQGFLGVSGSQPAFLAAAGTFKDRLLLKASPHHVVKPETSLLQLDTVKKMLDLSQHRELVPTTYDGEQRRLTGIGRYPAYQLIDV